MKKEKKEINPWLNARGFMNDREKMFLSSRFGWMVMAIISLLIALGAVGGVLADQWKEYFYCDSLPTDVLAVKGQKKMSGRSSNTKGSDNVISNGSVIAVADGQCMLIVEQGKVVEVCAEPGEFVYDSSTEPSIFAGSLGESIKESFKNVGKRFAFGGQAVFKFYGFGICISRKGTAQRQEKYNHSAQHGYPPFLYYIDTKKRQNVAWRNKKVQANFYLHFLCMLTSSRSDGSSSCPCGSAGLRLPAFRG